MLQNTCLSAKDVCSVPKEDVKVSQVGNEYLIELPKKVYDFYHLDEADYTIMTSETNPKTTEIFI